MLLLCSSFFNANAAFVSGNITANTTWTVANSPYIVNGNLTVDSGVVLTIQPGVEVRVDSTYIFQVDGKLLAMGTSADTIKFTSNSANPALHPWEGITFTQKSTLYEKPDSIAFACLQLLPRPRTAGTGLLRYRWRHYRAENCKG